MFTRSRAPHGASPEPAPPHRTDEVGKHAIATGPGSALPADVGAALGASLGADLSAVRVHEGDHVEAFGARAFTQGTDVHFAPGAYDPSSASGRALLGHELAHVVQQAEGRVAPTVHGDHLAINTDAALEAEADERGERAARGESPPPGGTRALSALRGGPVQGYFRHGGVRLSQSKVLDIEGQLRDRHSNSMDFLRDDYRTRVYAEEPTDLEAWLDDNGIAETALSLGVGAPVVAPPAPPPRGQNKRKEPSVPEAPERLEKKAKAKEQDKDKEDEEAEEPHDDGCSSDHEAPADREAEEPSFHGGTPLTNPKGGTQLSRTLSLVRTDSRGKLFGIPGSQIHKDLRTANVANHATAKKRTKNPQVNVFNLGVTLTYRTPDDKTHALAELVPTFWNSGLVAVSGEKDKSTTDALTQYFTGKPAVDGLNAQPPPDPFNADGPKANNAAMWGHSETNAAADPGTGKRLEDALDRLLATAKQSGDDLVMLSTTLDGDSMPNSVCTNGCRPAIEDLRAMLNESARQKVGALDFIRLSDHHVTDARVTSKKLFDGKRNPALKDATKSKGASNVDLPLVTGGPVTLEALPDQMGSKNAKPGYQARKDTYVTASDVALDPATISAWILAHADHPLVKQLASCDDAAEALAICADASLEGLDELWAAFEQERELTAHARRVAIYSIWALLRKQACSRPDDRGGKPPPPDPGPGGSGLQRMEVS